MGIWLPSQSPDSGSRNCWGSPVIKQTLTGLQLCVPGSLGFPREHVIPPPPHPPPRCISPARINRWGSAGRGESARPSPGDLVAIDHWHSPHPQLPGDSCTSAADLWVGGRPESTECGLRTAFCPVPPFPRPQRASGPVGRGAHGWPGIRASRALGFPAPGKWQREGGMLTVDPPLLC